VHGGKNKRQRKQAVKPCLPSIWVVSAMLFAMAYLAHWGVIGLRMLSRFFWLNPLRSDATGRVGLAIGWLAQGRCANRPLASGVRFSFFWLFPQPIINSLYL